MAVRLSLEKIRQGSGQLTPEDRAKAAAGLLAALRRSQKAIDERKSRAQTESEKVAPGRGDE